MSPAAGSCFRSSNGLVRLVRSSFPEPWLGSTLHSRYLRSNAFRSSAARASSTFSPAARSTSWLRSDLACPVCLRSIWKWLGNALSRRGSAIYRPLVGFPSQKKHTPDGSTQQFLDITRGSFGIVLPLYQVHWNFFQLTNPINANTNLKTVTQSAAEEPFCPSNE